MVLKRGTGRKRVFDSGESRFYGFEARPCWLLLILLSPNPYSTSHQVLTHSVPSLRQEPTRVSHLDFFLILYFCFLIFPQLSKRDPSRISRHPHAHERHTKPETWSTVEHSARYGCTWDRVGWRQPTARVFGVTTSFLGSSNSSGPQKNV